MRRFGEIGEEKGDVRFGGNDKSFGGFL